MKYLNPNTVVLVVFSPATSSASVQLVDSTSGGLLHKFGPIADINDDSNFSLVFRDNWIIYSYRVAGDAARVTEIVSVELYHPPGDHADSS